MSLLILDLNSLLEDPNLSLPQYTVEKRVSHRTSKINMLLNQEGKSFDLQNEEIGRKENIKEENVSYKEKSENSVQDLSSLSETQTSLNSMI